MHSLDFHTIYFVNVNNQKLYQIKFKHYINMLLDPYI